MWSAALPLFNEFELTAFLTSCFNTDVGIGSGPTYICKQLYNYVINMFGLLSFQSEKNGEML